MKQITEILCMSRTAIILPFLSLLFHSVSCANSITSASFNYHPVHLGVIFEVSQYTLILPGVKIYSSPWK